MMEIPKIVIDEIRSQALLEAPNEACGYLAGTNGQVVERIQMTNVDNSAEHFSFDPAEQFAAAKEARKNDLGLIAVYHSHPETEARMSDEDIRLANDPELTYVIMSLANGLTKAFRVNEDKTVTVVSLQII